MCDGLCAFAWVTEHCAVSSQATPCLSTMGGEAFPVYMYIAVPFRCPSFPSEEVRATVVRELDAMREARSKAGARTAGMDNIMPVALADFVHTRWEDFDQENYAQDVMWYVAMQCDGAKTSLGHKDSEDSDDGDDEQQHEGVDHEVMLACHRELGSLMADATELFRSFVHADRIRFIASVNLTAKFEGFTIKSDRVRQRKASKDGADPALAAAVARDHEDNKRIFAPYGWRGMKW